MNKSLGKKFKQNVIIISIILTLVFLIINVALYVINNNYLVDKIEEENNAFLSIATHIINENDVEVALEYIEHYTHIHEVNIEVHNQDGEMIFSSKLAHRYTSTYTTDTLKGTYTIFIDNTDSVTVNRVEMNTLYVNVSLLIIYVLSLAVLIRLNKRNSNQINNDVKNVMELMASKNIASNEFNHSEFEHIYKTVNSYLENIDMLREQKEMNMKGLAHDIKTPLTLVYSYFERVMKNEVLSDKEVQIAFDSSKRINDLLNDLIENKERSNLNHIDISKVLNDKLLEYSSILVNKNMSLKKEIASNVKIYWNDKDLTRVIDNIISNAYYYSKKDSVLVVTMFKNEKILIKFRSTPISLENIDLQNIFSKGYRGIESRNENNYGKGYGLYICRLLLNSIGGSIEARIDKKDVEFTIIL